MGNLTCQGKTTHWELDLSQIVAVAGGSEDALVVGCFRTRVLRAWTLQIWDAPGPGSSGTWMLCGLDASELGCSGTGILQDGDPPGPGCSRTGLLRDQDAPWVGCSGGVLRGAGCCGIRPGKRRGTHRKGLGLQEPRTKRSPGSSGARSRLRCCRRCCAGNRQGAGATGEGTAPPGMGASPQPPSSLV